MLKSLFKKNKKASGPTKKSKKLSKPKAKAKKAPVKRVKPKAKPKILKTKKIVKAKAMKPVVKKSAKGKVKRAPANIALKPIFPAMKMGQPKEVGRITHYFDNIGVAVIELSSALRQGDQIEIKGSLTNVTQRAASMQVSHLPVSVAQAGESIGLKVSGKVREGDRVYRLG